MSKTRKRRRLSRFALMSDTLITMFLLLENLFTRIEISSHAREGYYE